MNIDSAILARLRPPTPTLTPAERWQKAQSELQRADRDLSRHIRSIEQAREALAAAVKEEREAWAALEAQRGSVTLENAGA